MKKTVRYSTNFASLSRFYLRRKTKYAAEKTVPKRFLDLTHYAESVEKAERDEGIHTLKLVMYDVKFWKNEIPLLCEIATHIVGRGIAIEIIPNENKRQEYPLKKKKHANITLFSGGLDSFLSALENPDSVLVHVEKAMATRCFARKSKSFIAKFQGRRLYEEIPYVTRKMGEGLAISNSRALVFICLGAMYVPVYDANEIIIGENGLLIYNPPIFEGAEMTRGLRPDLTVKIEKLLTDVCGKKITLRFPDKSMTKKEVLCKIESIVGKNKFPKILKITHSCSQQQPTKGVKGKMLMCGLCYACVVRRISTLSMGVDESNNYIHNPFNETISSKERGKMHVADLCRFVRLYKKNLLTAKQNEIIMQNKEVFDRYCKEIIDALKAARELDMLDERIAEKLSRIERILS